MSSGICRVSGSIWQLASAAADLIVIPTNIGWRKNGTNVMGRGLAYQAAKRWPQLAEWYGDQCIKHREATPVLIHRPRGYDTRNLALFPVKPLNPTAPWMSWEQPASLEVIRRSAKELRIIAEARPARIFMPLVGCGNGGLKKEQVLPILEEELDGLANIYLVERK